VLAQIIDALTSEQKHALYALDIPKARLSDWKVGRRLPTLPQAKTLAIVAAVDPEPLLQWLAEQEATPAQRGLFRRFMEAAAANALGALIAPAGAVILSACFVGKSEAATTTYGGFRPTNAIYIVALWRRLREALNKRLTRQLHALLKAPSWGLFSDLARPKDLAC
jgi:hypothetical protein